MARPSIPVDLSTIRSFYSAKQEERIVDAQVAQSAALSSGWRRYTVGLLLAITFVSFLDRQVLTILIEPMKADLRLSDSQIGALTGLFFSLFYAVTGLPMARIADRYDKRKVISISIAAWSLATAFTGMAQNFVQLAIARTAVGIGEAGTSPAITSIVADLFPPERRASIFSAIAASSAVGIGFSVFLGGMLVEHFSWRTVMIVLAIPGLLISALVLFTLPQPQRRQYEIPPPMGATLAGLWRIPTYRALAVIIFTSAASGFAIMTWMAVMLVRVHGLPTGQVGLIVGACMSGGFLTGNLLCGIIADRLAARDSRWLLVLLGTTLALNLPLGAVAFLSNELHVAVAAFALLLVSGGFWAPLAYTMGMGVVRPEIRAVTASTLGIILSLGGAAGPFLVGILADHFSDSFGNESIRYALTIILGGYAIGAVAGFAAIARLKDDYLADRPVGDPSALAEELAPA
jgi:predicted MFS family arabinose efflux permease